MVQPISWNLQLLAVFFLLWQGGCSLEKSPCDSLVPEYCGLPYPNSYFTVKSSETATGVKLNLSSQVFPKNSLGISVDPAMWNTFDGFSPFPSILTYFPELGDSNLPPHWRMGSSLDQNSPTILINADTGQKLAHFAELDSVENVRLPVRRALMLWPSQRLEDSTRYIVALRYLRNHQGQLVTPSNTFKALRDNVTTGDPSIDSRREHFEDIFQILQSAGVDRSSLQLAWDFTTASLKSITGRFVFARDDAFNRLPPDGASYHFTHIQDNYNEHIYRRIQGNVMVPLYLTSALPGSELVIDTATNLPVYQRNTPVKFTLLVPHSVANGTQSKPLLLQYGHGLFGDQSEVETGYLVAQADSHGYIMFACDWWGMAEYDVPAIAAAINLDPSKFNIVPDRLTQAMVNALVLMRTMKGKLHVDETVTIGGKVRIDPALSYYYGNSQGGIMGSVYMAATADVTRGVLGVAGGPYMLLLPRSVDFKQFEVDLRVLHPDPVNYILSLSQWGVVWSRLGPNGYMSHITSHPIDGVPVDRRVLYHYALGDAQVNLLGLYSLARSSNAVVFESNVHGVYAFKNGSGLVKDDLYGLRTISDDDTVTHESVAMGFDFGAPPEPRVNVPPDGNHDTHEKPRRSPLAQEQMESFLRTGEITNVCKGPCKEPSLRELH